MGKSEGLGPSVPEVDVRATASEKHEGQKAGPLPQGTLLGFCASQFLELLCSKRGRHRTQRPREFPSPPAQAPCGRPLLLTQARLALEATCKLSAGPRVDPFSILGMKGSLPFSTWLSVAQNELLIPLLETGLPQLDYLGISEAMSSPY